MFICSSVIHSTRTQNKFIGNEHDHCQTAVGSIRPGHFQIMIYPARRTITETNRFILSNRKAHEQRLPDGSAVPSEFPNGIFDPLCVSEQTFHRVQLLFVLLPCRLHPCPNGESRNLFVGVLIQNSEQSLNYLLDQ